MELRPREPCVLRLDGAGRNRLLGCRLAQLEAVVGEYVCG